MNIKKLVTLSVMMFLIVSGCASTSKKDSKDSADTNGYPMTIKHAFGETVLKSKPKRVATISWGNQDVPLALGVVPLGASKVSYGDDMKIGLYPWTLKKYKELGEDKPVLFDDTDSLDYEAISKTSPDVILAGYSGITKEEYDLLSKIAPVVPYENKPYLTSWRDQIRIDATGMGMAEEGKSMIQKLDSLLQEKVKQYPQIKGKTAAFAYFNPKDYGNFTVFLPEDSRVAYLTDLGLKFPDEIKALGKNSASFHVALSAENADVLKNVDIILTYGDAASLKAMQKDKLLKTIPAIAKGSVALFKEGSSLAASANPSALSIPATIDDYLKVIADAADKVK